MTEIHNKTILIIGAGNMGISFISSLIKNKFSGKKIIVLEPKPSKNVLNLKKGKKIVKHVYGLVGCNYFFLVLRHG